jgi:RNA polymerase sigma-70 factor (ECF subfamily)
MTPDQIDRIFREEAGRALATLIRLVGDFDLAEDAMQEAFAEALQRWPASALPGNPRAWLVNVGRNKAIDRIRRQIAFRGKQHDLARHLLSNVPDDEVGKFDTAAMLDDDMLRLIFTCCHPAFAIEVQVALTLRTVCGLSTAQVARAFVVSEEAMAQRLVRAKQKIRLAGIPYQVPQREQLAPRLRGVLAAIYLMFTEGYVATSGDELMRPDLAREAIRLCRLLDALMPRRTEIIGLLALMLLHDARRAGRATADGDVVLLEHQDRALWDHAQIAEGLRLVDQALRERGPPQPYAVQAAIAALHARAPSYQQTDWPQIAGLYEVLLRISPSPVIELNHAAAVSMVDGPARALDLIDALEARGRLRGYELLQAVRADLLRRLDRRDAAREAYRAASAATQLEPLRRLYARRIAELDGFDQNARAADATTGCADSVESSACSVDSVEASATPSTRSGRK